MSTQSWNETLVTSQVDGPTITAIGAVTCIPAAAKIILPPPPFWQIGRCLRISASGRVSTVITTPGTLRFDVRIAGTVVFDSLAILPDTVAAHTTVGWGLEITLTCRAIGATANLFGFGAFTCEDILGVPATAPKGVLTAVLPWNAAPAVGGNFDSTAASQSLDMFFTQTVATGSLTVHQYKARVEN